MNFAKTKKALSTSTGVTYFRQFLKNFLRPYGKVEGKMTDEKVLKRVSRDSCEWFSRPKVAMSELSETIVKNIEVLEELALPEALKPLNTE